MSNSRHIPAIDGIRSLAVFSVIAFHFGVPFFDGGFVGVDIFFVISGFVIFRSIAAEWDRTGGFSWRKFTMRRVRRLAPAVFFMISVSSVLAWVILDPIDLRSFGNASLSHLFCASNIYFAETMGYFSGAAELYPLLHTWSLSVEEQFYLLVPFLVLFVTRFPVVRREKILVKSLWIAGIASLIAGIIVCNNSPSHGFYLSLTRAWEFCAGAILAFVPLNDSDGRLKWRRGLSLAGLLLLLVSIYMMDPVKYPRAQALVPVFGSVFLIAGLVSFPGSLMSRVFSVGWVVWLGRLSYSLYLWHWPFLSFKEHLKNEASVLLLSVLFAIGFLFAVVSYYLVEQPFRFRFSQRRTMAGILVVWTGLVLWSAALAFGWVGREATPVELAYRKDVDWYGEEFRGSNVPIGAKGDKIDFVLWGDSHSGMISGLVDRLGKENGLVGRAFVSDTTLPIPNTPQYFPDRQAFNDGALAAILNAKPEFVLIVSSWAIYVEKPGILEIAQKNLLEMVERLHDEGITPIVLRQVPLGEGKSGARGVLVAKRFPTLNEVPQWGMPRSQYVEDRELEASLFEESRPFLTILDPGETFFENEKERVLLFDKTAFYRDVGHLSFSGAERFISPLLTPIFERFGSEEASDEKQRPIE